MEGMGWVGGWGGRGIAELDACKIRNQKMMYDQALDCRQDDDGYITDRQVQCSHKDFMVKYLIALEIMKDFHLL